MPKPATALRPARGPAPRRAPARLTLLGLATLALAPACFDRVSLGSGLGDGGSGGSGPRPPTTVTSSTSGGLDIPFGDIGCHPGLTTDLDGDGWTPAQGDCNDCDPDVGPSAVEMPTEDGDVARDENCDGHTDEPQPMCDVGLAVDEASPYAAARALDLCSLATPAGLWGLNKALWVLPDGSPPPTSSKFSVGHGVLDRFGPNVSVRYGNRMLALSSGTARQPTDPGYVDPAGFEKDYPAKLPAGSPLPSPSCPGVEPGPLRDGVALELEIRVPQNAEALAFDFDFYTHEFPQFVCSTHDDLFVALLASAESPSADANIAFDSQGHPIHVNGVSFDVCGCTNGPPCFAGGLEYACSLGPSELLGTGFGADTVHDGDRAATGWQTSTGQVERGSTITLRFAIADAEDGRADSTVLIDHLRWLPHEPLVARTARDPD